MTRIIKRWEITLYYLLIFLIAGVLIYISYWQKSKEYVIKLDKITLENIYGLIFVVFLNLFIWGKYKVAQTRIMKLSNEWQEIDAFSSKKTKYIISIYIVLAVLFLFGIRMTYSNYLLLLIAWMNKYFERILNKGYLDSKRFIVKNKMYELDEIVAYKDNFGTNFNVYYDHENYQIFTGSDLIKDRIIDALKGKRRLL